MLAKERVNQAIIILNSPVFSSRGWAGEYSKQRVAISYEIDQLARQGQCFFKPHGEEEFGIYDPYDLEKGDVPGVLRYLYPKGEIQQILQGLGFKTNQIDHYYGENYFGILAEKSL